MDLDQPAADSVAPQSETVSMTLGQAIAVGQTLQKKGLLLEANEIYQQILALKPEQPEALHFLGVVRYQLGFPEQGIQLVLAALEFDPDYVDALSNLGNMFRRQGQHDHAEEAYRRAIALKPEFAEAHLNLAALLYERHQFEEAIAETQRAAELSPQILGLHAAEMNLFASTCDHAGTAEAYLRAMERKLFDSIALENIARLFVALNRKSEAVDIYRRWLSLEPDNPRARHYLAGCTGVEVPLRASDDYIQDEFDRFAASFDRQLTKLEYTGPTLINDAVKAELGEPQSQFSVLDAACGTGLCGPGIRPFARHLVGVDLSPKMLEKARERGVYDKLHEAELTGFLSRSPQAFDIIISADTLIYFGDLSSVVAAAAVALRPQGRFVFTAEKADPENAPHGFRLESHGRYQHTENYIRQVVGEAALEFASLREVFLRKENSVDVMGWLVVVRST